MDDTVDEDDIEDVEPKPLDMPPMELSMLLVDWAAAAEEEVVTEPEAYAKVAVCALFNA